MKWGLEGFLSEFRPGAVLKSSSDQVLSEFRPGAVLKSSSDQVLCQFGPGAVFFFFFSATLNCTLQVTCQIFAGEESRDAGEGFYSVREVARAGYLSCFVRHVAVAVAAAVHRVFRLLILNALNNSASTGIRLVYRRRVKS